MSAPRVMVGVSGGVDSAVAALRLRAAGENIAGLFMQNWDEDGAQDRAEGAQGEHGAIVATQSGSGCRADADRRDALGVCARLGIAFHARNFAGEYWSAVFEHFLAEYRAGRTPNPDVACNREIKFKTFLDEARALGAEQIATGHYARTDCVDGRWRLLRALDRDKDQTYFLHQLGQSQLAATLFPVGDLPKAEVRRLAADAALPVANKKDSTGICFVGERDFREFLSRYIPARPGEIRSVDGARLGEHAGVFFYTMGQREGLQLGGQRGRPGAPWFVVGKDVAANVLVVDQGSGSPYLQSRRLASEQAHFIAGAAPAASFSCRAQVRHRQPPQDCTVTVRADGGLDVEFASAQRAVAPGQSLVLYAGDECLGGAVIAGTDALLDRLEGSRAA